MTKTTTIIMTDDFVARLVNGKFKQINYNGKGVQFYHLGESNGKYYIIPLPQFDSHGITTAPKNQEEQLCSIIEQIVHIENGMYND